MREVIFYLAMIIEIAYVFMSQYQRNWKISICL